MSHELELRHLGPIDYCKLSIEDFTIFTGPQSNGKSTVAKAIYFFRTIKQDILSIMLQGGPQVVAGNTNTTWEFILRQRMKDKFLQLFGTSWIMPHDMMMKYTYKPDVYIRVYLTEHPDDGSKNYISFEFSKKIEDYFDDVAVHSFTNITAGQKNSEENNLNKLFDDPYETVFIPAGRNLITLLSTQLNYIFTSLEDSQLRNIDYITKKYTELILKLKPMFDHGMQGVINDVENDPVRQKKYEKNRAPISLLLQAANQVLNGTYRYTESEERLYISDNKYVKINLSSSGQQEVVWVFNLLFYYLIENRKIFLILEEPESHLYPSSQQTVGEVLALILNCGNTGLITTHSPYILGTFNYLLLATQTPEESHEQIKRRLRKWFWIDPKKTTAYYIHGGAMETAIREEESIKLIKNELIDGASSQINDTNDFLLEFLFDEEEQDDN